MSKSDEQRKQAEFYIREYLPAVVAQVTGGKAGTIKTFAELDAAADRAWLAIESIPEILDLKIDMLAALDKAAPEDCIIASNSSSFPASQLIGKVRLPERVINTHFYRPPVTKVVEIMSCGKTTPEIMDFIHKVFTEFGLNPFLVRKESTGFIFNRIWAAIKRESLYVAAEGVSTPEEIDRIFSYLGDFRPGVFHGMDAVGLDVVYDIEQHYAQTRPGLPEAPRRYLKENYLDKGSLGVKSGQGFFDYPDHEESQEKQLLHKKRD